MRIALLTDPELRTGRETTLKAIASHSPADFGFNTYATPCGLDAGRVRETLREIERDRVDLLHLAVQGPAAAAILYLAWRSSLPVVGSFDLMRVGTSRTQATWFSTLHRRCDRLLVASMCARRRMIEAGVHAERIVQWRPGVDCRTFTPAMRLSTLRERWQVSDSRPALIYAGHLSDGHGARRLLSLELALQRSHPMHRLIIVGDGPSRAELEFRCSRAVFVGRVARERMPEILASGDLFVSPGEEGQTAHAVLEAQASGLPCLVMEGGSAAERVSEASAVVCGSTVEWIVGTASMLRDHVRRKERGRAAREHALRQDWVNGLSPLYAGYRLAADTSDARRDLRPALISQGRRL